MTPRVVLDTNVVVAGLRSNRGASFRLLSLVDSGRFEICLSVPLVIEYEAALFRSARSLRITRGDLTDLLDYLCAVAHRQPIFFLWRPRLRDPHDDMVLELAVAAGCRQIVTFNTADFAGSEAFGVRVVTPRHFLGTIGALP